MVETLWIMGCLPPRNGVRISQPSTVVFVSCPGQAASLLLRAFHACAFRSLWILLFELWSSSPCAQAGVKDQLFSSLPSNWCVCVCHCQWRQRSASGLKFSSTLSSQPARLARSASSFLTVPPSVRRFSATSTFLCQSAICASFGMVFCVAPRRQRSRLPTRSPQVSLVFAGVATLSEDKASGLCSILLVRRCARHVTCRRCRQGWPVSWKWYKYIYKGWYLINTIWDPWLIYLLSSNLVRWMLKRPIVWICYHK